MAKHENNKSHVTFDAKTGYVDFGGKIEISSYNGLIENMGAKDFLDAKINENGDVIGAVIKYNAAPLVVNQVAHLSYFTRKIDEIISKGLKTSMTQYNGQEQQR